MAQISQLESQMLTQIQLAKFECPTREYQFCKPRKWRFDFAWPLHKIALECEGGTWVHGRHSRPSGFLSDCEKYNEATLLGWRVLRVTGDHIKSGAALTLVQRALEAK